MKKIYLLLIAVLLSTFSTWAAPDLSFTIWPETSGTFSIWYSTYKAPSGSCVFVDWGDGICNYPKAETGSDPSKLISGTVTKGKPIYIYSDYIDAIYIVTESQAILCNENNPQLQYFYYFKDNLSPQNLEAFYLSLKDRSSKSNWGELHLTNDANISNNIKKSNAFITIDKKWAICSNKAYTGSVAKRTHWLINSEVVLKSILIPAIEITTPTTANIELRLGMTPDQSLPWHSIASKVRIDDGTNNHKSEFVYRYNSNTEFWNSEKLTVKGTGASGIIKIYGAMVSHLMTSGISSLNFNGTTNMRHLRIDNSSNLNSLPGLNENKLLEYVFLYKTGFTIVDLSPLPNLKTLDLPYNYKLTYLYYNTSNLKTLNVSGCDKLDIGVLSVLKNSKKLTEISVGSMGWDACNLDEIYRNLYSPAPSGAQIYVEDICESNNFNDYEGSNKTIATNKGWKVILEYNCGAEKQLTGDGGGCKPDVVTCLLPLNRATNVSVNGVQLRFGFGANTSQYQLKWGKNFNQFSNVTSYKTTGGNTGLALAMPKLDFNTTYYWQINVKDKNGNERMGEIWSFTTEADSTPGAVTNTSPKNGATNIKNGELLEWKFGGNTGEHQVLLDTKYPPANVERAYQTKMVSSHELANLKPNTKYYWQVNAKNASGTTPGPIWSFTTAAASAPKPGAVTNTSPADGATDIENGELLKWTFGGNTREHQVLLDTKYPPANVGRAYQTKMISSYELANLKPNTKYYWQVIAKNATGETKGAIWSFTTAAASAPKPGAVTNTSPADGATDIENGELLKWTFGGNTREHQVLLDTKYPPANVGRAYQTKMISSYELANLKPNTKYYWQVIAKNATGETKGAIWSFTTADAPAQAPDAVTNNAPSNKATGIKNGDELKWTFGANTNEYQLMLGTSSTPSDVAVSYTSTLASSYSLSGLKYSTKYYWQVIAKNATGETKGAIWSFTTADAPAQAPDAVTNNAPSNKATGIKNGDELKWTFGANTNEYQLLLGTSSTPSDVAVSYTSTLASSYSLSGLKYSTKYYWQVIAKNATGETKGAIWSFTTTDAPAQAPDAVTNTAPQNEATNIENGMFLSWTFGNNTSEYQLMMGTSNPPSNEMLPYTNTLVTSYTLSGLENNTTYYWQINTKNAEGTTAGSIWSFTTTPKTGINKAEASEAIQVYANGNELHLITSSNEAALVNVYNLTGQVVMKGKTNGSTHTILNASTLCNGIYMVSIIQNNKVAVSRKVYIQKR